MHGGCCSTVRSSLTHFLRSHRLTNQNVETIEDLSLMSKDDMKSLGLSLGHRNRIIKWQQARTEAPVDASHLSKASTHTGSSAAAA